MRKTVQEWSDLLDYLPETATGFDLYDRIDEVIDGAQYDEETDIPLTEAEAEMVRVAASAAADRRPSA